MSVVRGRLIPETDEDFEAEAKITEAEEALKGQRVVIDEYIKSKKLETDGRYPRRRRVRSRR
jgi:hypothetical protein